jgi:hypothetical protein
MVENLVGPQLAVPLAQALTDKVIKVCGYCSDEIKQALREDIIKYIGNFSEKFSKIKTFLFNDRIPFYSVYFPLSLKANNSTINVPDMPDSLFVKNNYLTILGHAGCGKTMILRHLFLSACEKSSKLPIVVELRKLKEYNGDLKDYISEKVFNFNLSQNAHIYQRMLNSGYFMFLFDGYDEISLGQKESITRNLEDFVDLYPQNYYLLTSRPGAGAENLERFENFFVKGLSEPQVLEFIDKQLSIDNTDENKELSAKIKEVLAEAKGTAYMKYMSSPLLLSMFILTFNEHPELPQKKSSFYYNVFDTLHSKHDAKSKAGGYQHEKKTRLSEDDIRKVLEAYCFVSYLQSVFEFSPQYIHTTITKILKPLNLNFDIDDLIYDLSVSVSLWVQDGMSYIFPHRSLQEFFAASYIANSREDLKAKIYGERLIKINNVESQNFWELCEELDGSCFTQYFLIPCMEEYVRNLENYKDPNLTLFGNILYNYLHLSKIRIESNIETNQFTMYEHRLLGDLITRYLGINKTPSIKLFDEVHLMFIKEDQRKNIFIKEQRFDYNIDDKRPEVIKFYEESGIFKCCEDYINLIKNKIEEKRLLLKSRQDDSTAILDLL